MGVMFPGGRTWWVQWLEQPAVIYCSPDIEHAFRMVRQRVEQAGIKLPEKISARKLFSELVTRFESLDQARTERESNTT
jgi:hypothetical protein